MRTLKFGAGEDGCRLDQGDVTVESGWETVGGCPDENVAVFGVLPDVIFL